MEYFIYSDGIEEKKINIMINKDFGDIITDNLTKFNKIIYDIEYVEVKFNDGEDKQFKIGGDDIIFQYNVNEYFADKEIIDNKVRFYFKEINKEEKNLEYINKYVSYYQIKQDELYAQQLQKDYNYEFGNPLYSRDETFPQTVLNIFNRIPQLPASSQSYFPIMTSETVNGTTQTMIGQSLPNISSLQRVPPPSLNNLFTHLLGLTNSSNQLIQPTQILNRFSIRQVDEQQSLRPNPEEDYLSESEEDELEQSLPVNQGNLSIFNGGNINLSRGTQLFSRLFQEPSRPPVSFFENIKVTLKTDDFDKLEKKLYKDIKDNNEVPKQCSISLMDFEDNDEIIKLPCGHYFELSSIKHWLIECNNKCPICREEVCKGTPRM